MRSRCGLRLVRSREFHLAPDIGKEAAVERVQQAGVEDSRKDLVVSRTPGVRVSKWGVFEARPIRRRW